MRGYHPNLVNGALLGALVTRSIVPAVGDESITTEGVDDNGQPLTLTIPNPDHVPAWDATCDVVRSAIETAGITVYECFESGDAPEGQARVAVQIYVPGDGASPDEQEFEALTRTTIDEVLATFAPA